MTIQCSDSDDTGTPRLTPGDEESRTRLLPLTSADRLNEALAWAAEFSGKLGPRQVHSRNRALQADIDAVDEHFRRKKFVRRLQHQRRRSRLAQVESTLTAAEWNEIVEQHGHRCVYCGEHRKRLTIDHVVPLSKGGPTTKENVVPACKRCNSRKGARLPENFLDSRRRQGDDFSRED